MMEQDNFYLTLFSNGSPLICKNNTQTKFKNYLNHPLKLEGKKKWNVGIVDFFHNSVALETKTNTEKKIDTDMLFIHCDIINEQMIGDQCVKIIRTFPIKKSQSEYIEFLNIQYVPVDVNYIDSISFILTNLENKQPKFITTEVPSMIRLHFKKDI